jgi:hypothetical protein
LIGIRTHSPRFAKCSSGAGFLFVHVVLIGERNSERFVPIRLVGWDERWDARSDRMAHPMVVLGIGGISPRRGGTISNGLRLRTPQLGRAG